MKLDEPRKILGSVDVSALQREVASLTESDWMAQGHRQKTFEVHKQTQSIVIYFHSADDEIDDPDLRQRWEPLVRPLLAHFAQHHNYQRLDVSKIMLARMKPGTQIEPHTDRAAIFARYHRVHVPLQTHPDVEFIVDGERLAFEQGVMYDVNNLARHSVANRSDIDRIHLIFDVREHIDAKTEIDYMLFVVAANDPYVAALTAALTDSQHAISLPGQGQYIPEYAGPCPDQQVGGSLWTQSEHSYKLQDPANYDWPAIKSLWLNHATRKSPAARVFVEHSTADAARVAMLTQQFPGSRYIFSLRNPYAHLQALIQAQPRRADIAVLAARHIVALMKWQAQHLKLCKNQFVYISYEELCSDTEATQAKILELVPEFTDLDLLASHLQRSGEEQLENNNRERIAQLHPQALQRANQVFERHRDLLHEFGYQIIKTR